MREFRRPVDKRCLADLQADPEHEDAVRFRRKCGAPCRIAASFRTAGFLAEELERAHFLAPIERESAEQDASRALCAPDHVSSTWSCLTVPAKNRGQRQTGCEQFDPHCRKAAEGRREVWGFQA